MLTPTAPCLQCSGSFEIMELYGGLCAECVQTSMPPYFDLVALVVSLQDRLSDQGELLAALHRKVRKLEKDDGKPTETELVEQGRLL